MRDRAAFRSTCLRWAEYSDRWPYLLRLRFMNGGSVAYRGVPPAVYQRLLAAPSKGKAYNAFIKGKYPPA